MFYYVAFIFLTQSAFSAYIRHKGAVHHIETNGDIQTLAWAVILQENSNKSSDYPYKVAEKVGLDNQGQVGQLKNHYLFVHPLSQFAQSSIDKHAYRKINNMELFSRETKDVNFMQVKHSVEKKMMEHSEIESFHLQIIRKRVKRGTEELQDPMFQYQWHLLNKEDTMMDINVTGIWERNITGKGVTVCVIDDGLEWTNRDLKDNYCPEGSWDLNDDDSDPMPEGGNGKNEHGTRCAGEIAAAANDFCGVGVAFSSRIAGLRALDGTMTDSLEATAFNLNMNINDIYSCSWGPEDDGKTVEGPHYLALKAIKHGIDMGRGGYGSIFVVASGNGGSNDDNCNFDGYASSIYTITIGAVTESGGLPFYAEECPAMLGVTFSSGSMRNFDIVTSDWTKVDGSGCTRHHTGTSAAAPLAAGMIALMLEVRPCLTWRDIQYIFVLTGMKVNLLHQNLWEKNAAGLWHSNFHGFGILNAWRLVSVAKAWQSVPWLTTYTSPQEEFEKQIPSFPDELVVNISVSKEDADSYGLFIVEYVQVKITLSHPYRGHLVIMLQSPAGTASTLTHVRPKDNSTEGLNNWSFTSVKFWGEEPYGTWSLILLDSSSGSSELGTFKSWRLVLHGTPMTSEQFQDKKRFVEEAYSGKYLDENISFPCPPPSPSLDIMQPLTDRTLKIITLVGFFAFFMAIYETFEYMCCYKDEKKKQANALQIVRRQVDGSDNSDTYQLLENDDNNVIDQDNIAENVPMIEVCSVKSGQIGN
ncbi:proprotein convertase subtilisin/kexin type 7-like [Limulus polyphemus]|uniref:Proprotein convertase subtilisin/kexin type 7-like n=1 Tax=Limulus polyphemus TaxID=6850 RepID=A0ABM1T4C4_LIMPO|nr:proprotein convertase subtilisin/kexin type 7-like [Limulus polyphemus]XP_022250730.1 proprotein convertase subtilisin/kexin type 7-like [Limulus polyphemus]XP_022250771.1 proprotein convertase subtilisin/kexin type 7-like [Limulus polyphemus]